MSGRGKPAMNVPANKHEVVIGRRRGLTFFLVCFVLVLFPGWDELTGLFIWVLILILYPLGYGMNGENVAVRTPPVVGVQKV